MEVTSDVYTYDLPWSFGGHSEPLSVHVIESADRTILFGSGAEETTGSLIEQIGPHNIDVVIVEHGDIDHYGGVPRLRELWNVEVAVPAGDAQFLEEDDIEPDQQLQADRTYWGIETISTPGHTPDNMAYLFEDVLIAGDTVCGSESPFAAAGEWSGSFAPLSPDLNAADHETRESISNLLEYDFEVVLTTHGQNALSDGTQEIAYLVEALDAD